jgi:hypothetical protein
MSQVMKMAVSWGMCHYVFYGRSTVTVEEHAVSLFGVYINLSKEERRHSIGNSFVTEAVSEPIEHSGTDRKGYAVEKI